MMVTAAPLEKGGHDDRYSWMNLFEFLTQPLKMLDIVWEAVTTDGEISPLASNLGRAFSP